MVFFEVKVKLWGLRTGVRTERSERCYSVHRRGINILQLEEVFKPVGRFPSISLQVIVIINII